MISFLQGALNLRMTMKKDNVSLKEGYYISKRGRLFSRYNLGGVLTPSSWRELKCHIDKGGYRLTQLRVGGIAKAAYIHRLVAEAYVYNPDPKNKIYVCHKDNNRLNNYYKNLYWGTPTENMQQCARDGRTAKGDKNGMYGVSRRGAASPTSKLTKSQRKEIRLKHKMGGRICDLALEYNVSRITIRRVVHPEFRSFVYKEKRKQEEILSRTSE